MTNDQKNLRRWLRIVLRTAHLVGLTGLVGGVIYRQGYDVLQPWLLTVALTGIALMGTDLVTARPYFSEARGAGIMVKLALLVAAVASVDLRLALLLVVIALSSVISHAPSAVRHWALWGAARRGRGDDHGGGGHGHGGGGGGGGGGRGRGDGGGGRGRGDGHGHGGGGGGRGRGDGHGHGGGGGGDGQGRGDGHGHGGGGGGDGQGRGGGQGPDRNAFE